MSVQLSDEVLVRRALELAGRGVEADPNPRVGAVIVDAAGAVVGEGWHGGAGSPHAEVVALRAAGASARGGTASRIAAGGTETLRAAGVKVVPAVLADEAEQLNLTWTHRHRTGRPFVTWKLATTLDGRIAAADGSSRWITSAEARADVHTLRARCGAVVVGTGTALKDDPALTVRCASEVPHRQPLRVVLGDRVIPAEARLRDASAPTLMLSGHDPAGALARLAADGVHHVLLEGGPTLAAAFLRDGLVDEVVAYVAPVLLGAGATAVGDLGIRSIDEALCLEPIDITPLGRDVRITARPRP